MATSLAANRGARARAAAIVSALWLASAPGGTVLADTPAEPAAGAPTVSLPQSGLFSSIRQSASQGWDHEAVRGYFDQGTPPNVRRFYCLVDIKTGRKETNGVLGQTMPLPSGMTGIKVDSVSLYLCADAEREHILVTDGFTLTGAAARAAAPAGSPPSTPAPAVAGGTPPTPVPSGGNAAASPGSLPAAEPPSASAPAGGAAAALSAAPAAAPATSTTPVPPPVPATDASAAPTGAGPGAGSGGVPERIDVAGIRLGMSPDEVRAALKAKRLREYRESTETLSAASGGALRPLPNGRFVNLIAAWSADEGAEGEAYEVMFTPVPGHERAMAIVHGVGYAAARAPRETVLEAGLQQKYGAYGAGASLPQSPTWRYLAGGAVASGDACARRSTFGGLSALTPGAARENVALKLGAGELRYQVERCGVAWVTEDQLAAGGGALRDDRTVLRFTVTAYSPALALEGATSAESMVRAASPAAGKGAAAPQAVPDL